MWKANKEERVTGPVLRMTLTSWGGGFNPELTHMLQIFFA